MNKLTDMEFYVKSIFTRLIFVVLISAGSVFPQAYNEDISVSNYSEAISEARQVIKNFMKENLVPGMSITVSVNEKIIWSEGFGYADLENGIAATKYTKFRIGSISKPITATAMGILYERGMLNLDYPIQNYVPEFPKKRWTITTRQIASHQAGIRGYKDGEFLSSKHYNTVMEGIGIFMDDSLLFKPGTKYYYSSYGYNLLSAVIEGASKQNFLTIMNNEIFSKLGMHSITAEYMDSLITHRTSYYTISKDRIVLNAPFVDNSYKWAGGGFISNSEDIVTFGNSYLTNKLLKDSTIKLLTTPMSTSAGELTHYGLGWDSGTDDYGLKWFGHGGSSVGGRAFLIIYPESRIVIAALMNLNPSPAPVNETQKIANLLRSRIVK